MGVKVLKKSDVIIILAAILLFFAAAAYRYGAKPGAGVRVYAGGSFIASLPLSDDGRLEVGPEPGAVTNVIEVSGGAARFVYSDCPDGLCVRQGFISSRGSMAVCLPNRVVAEIYGPGAPPLADGISR